jgi:hypothetical protein
MTSSDSSPKSGSADPRVAPLDWPRNHGRVDEVLNDIAAKLARRRKRRIRQSGAALVLGFFVFAGAWGVPWMTSTGHVGSPAATRQSLALADGSTAELNARTRLKTDFRYGRRHLSLEEGEVFFSVVKDAGRPFLVETPAGLVRVTGTQFNIRLAPQGDTEITLIEGSVEFAPADRTTGESSVQAVALSAGRQLRSTTESVEVRTLDSVRSRRRNGLAAGTSRSGRSDPGGSRKPIHVLSREVHHGGARDRRLEDGRQLSARRLAGLSGISLPSARRPGGTGIRRSLSRHRPLRPDRRR